MAPTIFRHVILHLIILTLTSTLTTAAIVELATLPQMTADFGPLVPYHPNATQPGPIMKCRYYNALSCNETGLGCGETDQICNTEPDGTRDLCYMIWKYDQASGRSSRVIAGCWAGEFQADCRPPEVVKPYGERYSTAEDWRCIHFDGLEKTRERWNFCCCREGLCNDIIEIASKTPPTAAPDDPEFMTFPPKKNNSDRFPFSFEQTIFLFVSLVVGTVIISHIAAIILYKLGYRFYSIHYYDLEARHVDSDTESEAGGYYGYEEAEESSEEEDPAEAENRPKQMKTLAEVVQYVQYVGLKINPQVDERIINTLTKTELLAKGKFGDYFLVEDSSSKEDDPKVIKVLKTYTMKDIPNPAVKDSYATKKNAFLPKSGEKWLTEFAVGSLLAPLAHPNIIRFLGAHIDVQNEDLWILTEYYPTGDLFEYIKANTLEPRQVMTIVHGILCGLVHLHADLRPSRNILKCSIAHLNLRCSNILLTPTLQPRISDFSLARIIPHTKRFISKAPSYFNGPKHYIAPEVFTGTVMPTIQAFCWVDMYAFAIICWELISRCRVDAIGIVPPPYKPPYTEYFRNLPPEQREEALASHKQMHYLVAKQKMRPTIFMEYSYHVQLDELLSALYQTLHPEPDGRLTAWLFFIRIDRALLLPDVVVEPSEEEKVKFCERVVAANAADPLKKSFYDRKKKSPPKQPDLPAPTCKCASNEQNKKISR